MRMHRRPLLAGVTLAALSAVFSPAALAQA